MDIILWVMLIVFIMMALLCFGFVALMAVEFFQEIKQYKADRRKFEFLVKSDYVAAKERIET